jgi:hypothetical protein
MFLTTVLAVWKSETIAAACGFDSAIDTREQAVDFIADLPLGDLFFIAQSEKDWLDGDQDRPQCYKEFSAKVLAVLEAKGIPTIPDEDTEAKLKEIKNLLTLGDAYVPAWESRLEDAEGLKEILDTVYEQDQLKVLASELVTRLGGVPNVLALSMSIGDLLNDAPPIINAINTGALLKHAGVFKGFTDREKELLVASNFLDVTLRDEGDNMLASAGAKVYESELALC